MTKSSITLRHSLFACVSRVITSPFCVNTLITGDNLPINPQVLSGESLILVGTASCDLPEAASVRRSSGGKPGLQCSGAEAKTKNKSE